MKPFWELRERLLRAGVAPRHVRRYLIELADHLADLRLEEEAGGRSRPEAESAALIRLGGIDALVEAMVEQRQLQSWRSRSPWAAFGVAPVVLLAVAYLIAGLILWSGWQMFLPGTDSPFVGPLQGLAVLYFGLGRMDYFTAPILVGWGVAFFAAGQRSKALWPIVGLISSALVAGAVQFHAVRPHLPGAAGQVSLGFTNEPPIQGIPSVLVHAFGILLLTALPYLVWLIVRSGLDSRLTGHGRSAA